MDEYAKYKLMQGDCLWLLRFVSCGFFRLKIVKILLWLHILVHLTVNGLSIYYFLNVLDKKEFVYYAPVFFLCTYIINMQFILLFKNDLVANIKEEIPLWSIDSAGEKNRKKIKFEIFIINVFLIVVILLFFADVWFYLEPLERDREFALFLPILEHYLPNQKTILWKIYVGTWPLGGYSMMAHPLQLIYYTQHMRFQIHMCFEKITTAENVNLEIREEEIYYDQVSQNFIRKKLIFLIRRYQEFVKVHSIKTKEVYHLLAMLGISATLLGINIVLFFFSGKFYAEYIPRMGVNLLTTGSLFVATIVSAQSIEDQSDRAEERVAYYSHWYNYNSSNKKLFLIFLINLGKPRKIKISQNYSINYKFGLAIVRGIYSVLTVVINMIN